MFEISPPKIRSNLRRRIGKEYYIIKRKIVYILSRKKYAKPIHTLQYQYSLFSHQSFILRPLKDVDMYLQHNKKRNLELAIERINNTILKPGEIFSFWKLVGKPTSKKGYLEGLILNQGKIDRGIGGGLCQLGNLLFWIFAHSPIDIIERHRHSFDVFPDIDRTIPFGAGATLSYNYIDLQCKNNTDFSFQIKLWIEQGYLKGELFSDSKILSKYQIIEKNHIIKQQYWGGYSRHNQIIKVEIDKNKNIIENLLVENHALMMYNPYLENKKS